MEKLINWVSSLFNWVFGGNESSQEASSATPREKESEELHQIRANLADISESERTHWAQQVFNRYVYNLHDIRDPKRAFDLLRVAAALKNQYILRIDSEYYWSKLVQFVRYNAPIIHALPPEGLALIKYLAMPTTPVLADFLREEAAKVSLLGWQGWYIIEHINPFIEVEHASVRQQDEPPLENDGFDPLDPTTWKR